MHDDSARFHSSCVDTARIFSYRAHVETREKILETAVKLFSSHGYADTSLAQVARAARVSKALVLWYFESKDQLFRAALQHFLAPYEIDDHVLDGLDEQQQVEKLLDDYYDFIAEHLYSVRFVLGQVVGGDENSQELATRARELHTIYQGLLATILERGQKKGLFADTVRPAEDAALIMATLNGLLLHQLVEATDTTKARVLLARLRDLVRTQLRQQARRESADAPLATDPAPARPILLHTGS
jgi:AcrR family transcriptional regulator